MAAAVGSKGSQIKDFTSGNITKQLAIFAMPLFLSNLLQVVYNMVDMVVVGQVLGKVGLSGVSIGGDVSHFMTFIAMGFSAAGQVLIAQYIGEGRKNQIGKFVATMSSFLMLCALVISVVCLILREPILWWMSTPAESFDQALGYSWVSMVGLVFIYGYNIVSAILRGMGDSKHPFVFVSIAAVLNLLLDIVFVVWWNMEAAGAALATVISQAVSFLACVWFLYKKKKEFELEIKFSDFFHWDKVMLKELIGLGTPMAIKSASIQFSRLFVNSWINSYGVVVSAFSGIANKFSNICNLISNALNTAGASMVGQNIAAKKFSRVKIILWNLFWMSMTISVIISAAICLFPEQIFSIFTPEADVLALSWDYVPIAVLLLVGSALRCTMNGLVNGSGNYNINFATAILDGIVMRIGLSLLFGVVMGMEHIGFWLGDAVAGFTPFVIGIVFYYTGIWKRGRNSAAPVKEEKE